MSKKKYTPGPWMVSEENQGSIFGDLHNPKHDGDNPYIGTVAGIGTGELDIESEANAKLIAAAPDMFEAIKLAIELKDLWSAQQHGTVSADLAGVLSALQKMQDKLEAAFEKATQ